MTDKIRTLQEQLGKIIKGKKEVTDKIIMAILARGHVLLEDVPGVGKTTTALALSKLMGMEFQRIQFTPDVVPSDVTGFTMYNKETVKFEYRPGAVMCNFLLADEINRTSSKTQAALLEVMEEGKVTVDGETHVVPQPFVVLATENPVGSSGTQMLPESQLDRFMVCLSIGYPTLEHQMNIINAQRYQNPLQELQPATTAQNVIEVQNYLTSVQMTEDVLRYAILLCEATRNHPLVELGISPRGVSALVKMAKASAIIRGRNYVIPEDVQNVYTDVCAHRLVLRPQAQADGKDARMILQEIMDDIRPKAER